MNLRDYKADFDRRLARELVGRQRDVRSLGLRGDQLQLAKQVSAIATSGGKRLRPYLVNLMARSTGHRFDQTELQAAELAVELFHIGLLVHDDIMDFGEKRHGVATVHTAYRANLLRRAVPPQTATHVAASQAISVGDLLVAWTADLLAKTNNRDVWAIWASAFQTVVVGQILDVASTTQPNISDAQLKRKTLNKTAFYSVIGPLRIGQAIAGGQSKYNIFIEEFGRCVGLAFQMQDDLFDWASDGDHTWVRNYIERHANPKELTQFHRWLKDKDTQKLARLAESVGAAAAAQKSITSLYAKAKKLISQQPFRPSLDHEWQKLVESLEHRVA